jgi:hypothetical protein
MFLADVSFGEIAVLGTSIACVLVIACMYLLPAVCTLYVGEKGSRRVGSSHP